MRILQNLKLFPLLFAIIIFQFKSRAQGTDNLVLPAMFSDNMVLQQGIPITIWGTAKAGMDIKVSIAGGNAETVVNAEGKWMVKLPALGAGGPYVLDIISNKTISIKNVMIGEVWLASGQSNMNFNVASLSNSKETIAGAGFENIREFDVVQNVSQLAQNDLEGTWKKAIPSNTPGFSAVAYLFARQLHLDKKVAVGIIHSSWGGTPIESWMSQEMLLLHPDFRDRVLQLRQTSSDWNALNIEAQRLSKQRKTIVQGPGTGLEKGVAGVNYADTGWKTATYPILSSKLGIQPYHLVWLRKEITLPAGYPIERAFNLDIGTISDQDITYVNGVEVGRGNAHGKRIYKVPPTTLRSGKNIIAIRYLCEYGSERLGILDEQPVLYSADGNFKTPLDGYWKYNDQIEDILPSGLSYQNLPSATFNAMINPLIPYGIKGIIWYQGESNADRASQYRFLQPQLFTDWRLRWGGPDLPFLFVQLPNFKLGATWPQMREAQAESLKYANTGMAVSIDLGDPDDVHPKNKGDVAARLYLAAKKIAYHDPDVISSGPVYKSMKIEHNTMYLYFSNTGSGLFAKNAVLKGFSIAGADKVFHPVRATLKNNTVLIQLTDGTVKTEVRYGWEPNPDCTLYNNEGLPAAPFRTDNW